ncbi:hypothetical protein AgCh_001431 [Apium graveolens]
MAAERIHDSIGKIASLESCCNEEPDPVAAGAWLKEIEKAFNLIQGYYASECKPENQEATFYNYGKVGHIARSCETATQEVELMKERFAKLFLGEDMSGGATVFGELWRLEPLAPQKKAMWRREMKYLLWVSDSIVELVPSVQQFSYGGSYEVMATQPRSEFVMFSLIV